MRQHCGGSVAQYSGFPRYQPYAKKCACNMHLTDNNMRKATCMLNECCNRFLHSCNMHGKSVKHAHNMLCNMLPSMLCACYVHVMCGLFLKNANKDMW